MLWVLPVNWFVTWIRSCAPFWLCYWAWNSVEIRIFRKLARICFLSCSTLQACVITYKINSHTSHSSTHSKIVYGRWVRIFACECLKLECVSFGSCLDSIQFLVLLWFFPISFFVDVRLIGGHSMSFLIESYPNPFHTLFQLFSFFFLIIDQNIEQHNNWHRKWTSSNTIQFRFGKTFMHFCFIVIRIFFAKFNDKWIVVYFFFLCLLSKTIFVRLFLFRL